MLLPSPYQDTKNPEAEAAFEAAFNSHVNAAIAAAIATMPPPLQQPAAHAADAAVAVMWCRQAEACFRRSNITVSGTKFDQMLMKLPEAMVVSVHSLISKIQPGDDIAYERLKERLTDSYAKTRWQEAFTLIRTWATVALPH